MVAKTFKKHLQGKRFRLEVAFVGPPEVSANPLIGEPMTIETNVLGYPEDTDVEFRIFEPHRIHEDPVDTVTGKTIKEHRGVEVEWTLDYESKKDDLSSTRFVVIARCGDTANISEEFEVKEKFETTVKDSAGDPVPNAEVLLRAAGRENIKARADSEGKLEIEVPPGDYVVELLDED